METNKYYTPELSEFYIGFEYEFFDKNEKKWTLFEYEPYDDCLVGDVIGWINDNKVRVKYLDYDDIESLGWVPENEKKILYIINDKKGDRCALCYNNKIVSIAKQYPMQKMNTEKEFTHTMTFFLGVIKNKSELNKLLTQLGI